MWIALGLIGALWLVGAVIAPDKNGPGVLGQAKPAAAAGQAAAAPPPPSQR